MIRRRLQIRETIATILADDEPAIEKAREGIIRARQELEHYVAVDPFFVSTLEPYPVRTGIRTVDRMAEAGVRAGVGPMAAVAGAVAEFVSKDLLTLSEEIIIENGGDIYLATSKERTIGIYAGDSPLSLKIGVLIQTEDSPLGICTSSGTVGPSLSFGKADAICILSKSAALADAAATAVGNRVKARKDIESGLETGKTIEGVLGTLIIIGERMGVWGNIRLVQL